jgi:hypothetical protein
MWSCTRNSSSPTGPDGTPPGTHEVYSPTRITAYALDRAPETIEFENDDRGNALTEQSAGKYLIRCTYDANGNLLTQLTRRWRGGTWDDSIFQTRSYNTRGDIIRITTDQITTGVHSYSTSNYNASSQETDYQHQYYGHDTLLFSERHVKNYSSDGKMDSFVTETLKDGSFQKSDSISIFYGPNGKESRRNAFAWSTDGWKNRSRFDYQYNDAGAVTHTQKFNWIQEAWEFAYDYEARYDAQGNFAGSSYASAPLGAATDSSSLEYQTDEAGNLVQTLVESFHLGQLASRIRTTSTFDAFRNPVSTEAEAFTDGSWNKAKAGLILKYHGLHFFRSDCYRLEAKYAKYLK